MLEDPAMTAGASLMLQDLMTPAVSCQSITFILVKSAYWVRVLKHSLHLGATPA